MKFLCPKFGSSLSIEPETTADRLSGPDERTVANSEEKSTETQPDDSPEAWRVECEQASFHAGVLLRLANIPGGIVAAIVELIQTAPRSESDLETLPETTLFARIARAAYGFNGDTDSFRAATKYITEHLMKMPPKRRRLLEASLAGVFMGWLMSQRVRGVRPALLAWLFRETTLRYAKNFPMHFGKRGGSRKAVPVCLVGGTAAAWLPAP